MKIMHLETAHRWGYASLVFFFFKILIDLLRKVFLNGRTKIPKNRWIRILTASAYSVLSPPNCFLISPGIHVVGIVVSKIKLNII